MNWKKSFIITFDVFIAIYIGLAMTAFNKPDETADICRDLHISIVQNAEKGFLNENDVRLMLSHSGISLISQPMNLINTRQVEEILQGNELIDKAECYKSIDGVLCINIHQRVPVIRVMTQNGDDYYVDNHGEIIPHNIYTCHLLVATGNISKYFATKKLTTIAKYIQSDDFWKNQAVQLNILDDGSLELIPRVGDHIAYLGAPTDIEAKLERLRKFYKYGLNKAGWNRYSHISVEFDNQIICKRRKLPSSPRTLPKN
jgi:cell division protein FtsQ